MDRLTEHQRSALMSGIGAKDTKPEILVRSLLHRMGYRYRIHCRDLPGTPDIVFPRRLRVILVHGCFWHQHPRCRDAYVPASHTEYWLPKLERNSERDAENIRELNVLGLKVLTVWECQLNDQQKLQKRLQRFLGPTNRGL